MCAIAAIPALIGMGISIAGTAVSSGLEADAASKSSAAKEAAARQNARIVQAQRNAVIQEGAQQARATEIEGRQAAASGLAVVAKSGVSTQTGSAKNVPAVSAADAAAEAASIRLAAVRQAWGYDIQKDQYLEEAEQERKAGYLGTLSAGLSGASSLGGLGIQGAGLIKTYT